MQKSNLGYLITVTLVLLNVLIWLVFPPVNDGRPQFVRQYAGEIIGSTNIILMSLALLLAARPKGAEPFFGGLDKMYVAHRRIATTAFLLIFVHVLTVPISLNWGLGNYLAVIAFTGIVSLVLLSVSPRIPFLNKLTSGTYEGWRKLKRLIGIFFILGFLHALTIPNPLNALIAITWTQIFFIIGTGAYLYTEIFGRFFKKYLPYSVLAINHPNATTTEVVMRAKKDALQHQRAGQFIFVRFPSDKLLDESHPFTISSAPQEDVLRLTIKASGDFTRALFGALKPGMQAVVEGPYGLFDYKTGGGKQIWIAGGIGLTPFLAFMRAMNGQLDRDIHFYYSVRHPEEALFVNEIETAARQNPRLKPSVRYSSQAGSLSVDHILTDVGADLKDYHVYLCGPLAMIQAFEQKFLALGISKNHIHYEEFNFR